LLPDLIKFAYIPQSQHRINGDAPAPDLPGKLTDFSAFGSDYSIDNEEHVLVLEFKDGSKRRVSQSKALVRYFTFTVLTSRRDLYYFRSSLTIPPSLTPAAVKQLIEKRNQNFCEAVRE